MASERHRLVAMLCSRGMEHDAQKQGKDDSFPHSLDLLVLSSRSCVARVRGKSEWCETAGRN
eukprot:3069435-Rhodomonas_salina.1